MYDQSWYWYDIPPNGAGKAYREKWHKKRHRIFKKSGYRCVKCGAFGIGTLLTVDHIIPKSKGGTSAEENLQALCFHCNNRKGHRIEHPERILD